VESEDLLIFLQWFDFELQDVREERQRRGSVHTQRREDDEGK